MDRSSVCYRSGIGRAPKRRDDPGESRRERSAQRRSVAFHRKFSAPHPRRPHSGGAVASADPVDARREAARGVASVALLSTAGLSMKGDAPFDMDGERQRPDVGRSELAAPARRRDRGDDRGQPPAHRHRLHRARPERRAAARSAARARRGRARSARSRRRHYSIMGYQGNDTTALETRSAPEIAAAMRERGGRPGAPRTRLTRLLPVRGTGREGDRGRRHSDRHAQHDLGLPAPGRHAARRGDRAPLRAALRRRRRRRRRSARCCARRCDVFETAREPGHVEHLPFVWHEDRRTRRVGTRPSRLRSSH